jgi:translation initiation factor IF-1
VIKVIVMHTLIRSVRCAGVALLSGTVLSACQHQPPAPVFKDEMLEMTATVEQVDLPNRMVVVRGENGVDSPVTVGADVRNLPQVQIGDRIVLTYYQGVAAEVKKPGTDVKHAEASAQLRALPGQRPAGAAAYAITTTVQIESVDTSFDTVTFRRPDGFVRTLAVQDPNARRFIHGLRQGDKVEVTYTEAVAVQIRPAG